MSIQAILHSEALGEALAAELRFDIEQLDLGDLVSAEYMPEEDSVHIVWLAEPLERGIRFPATSEWLDWMRTVLHRYSRKAVSFARN